MLMLKKKPALVLIACFYLFSYFVAYFLSKPYQGMTLRLFVFDIVATCVIFAFSVICRNSSVYDAYWSATPIVMILWLFHEEAAHQPIQLLFLVAFLLWAVRLTLNWCEVFTDFSYEDWRYRKYRQDTPKFLWPFVNFFGIHFMPTLVVFAGMLPAFVIAKTNVTFFAFPGIMIMICGVCLQYFADRDMHVFLASEQKQETCRIGLWSYSRHPYYLGEITFWLGVYLSMLPLANEYWYYGIGFVAVAVLFNVVSIPLMEARQLKRRADYERYQQDTPRLLIHLRRP